MLTPEAIETEQATREHGHRYYLDQFTTLFPQPDDTALDVTSGYFWLHVVNFGNNDTYIYHNDHLILTPDSFGSRMNETKIQKILATLRMTVDQQTFDVTLTRTNETWQPNVLDRAIELIDQSWLMELAGKEKWSRFCKGKDMLDKYFRDEKLSELARTGVAAKRLFAVMYPLEYMNRYLEHHTSNELLASRKYYNPNETISWMRGKEWDFCHAALPVHWKMLKIINRYEKRVSTLLHRAELHYFSTGERETYIREINRLMLSEKTIRDEQLALHLHKALDPILEKSVRTLTKKRERRGFIGMTVTDKILHVMDNITGKETAENLNNLAQQINRIIHTMTVGDILQDNQTYSIPNRSYIYLVQMHNVLLTDLYRLARDAKEDEKLYGDHPLMKTALLFEKHDVFEPLILNIAKKFQHVPADKASRLIALLYRIDNPFIMPSREAEDITEKAYQQWKRARGIENKVTPEDLNRVARVADEFVLTLRNWVTAWTYFGQDSSQSFLEMLTDATYGPRLFEDIVRLDVLFAPPQVLGLTRNLSVDKHHIDPIAEIKRLYDQGGSIYEYYKLIGMTYQVSGLQRSDEYSQLVPPDYTKTLLETLIPEADRNGAMISFGGALGFIESSRAITLGCTGPIAVFDQFDEKQLLDRSLILRNEFEYIQDVDPFLSPDELRRLLATRKPKTTLIQSVLPKTADDIRAAMHTHGIKCDPTMIFDQRFTWLYTKEPEQLAMVETAFNLLAVRGGTYFSTKGWANKLNVDTVFRVDKALPNQQPMVSLILFHHTKGFFSDTNPYITGQDKPIPIHVFAENGSRIGIFDSKIQLVGLQPGRVARNLEAMQLQMTVNIIMEKFAKEYAPIVDYSGKFEPPLNYSKYLTVAYTYHRGLPLYVPATMTAEDLPHYRHIVEHLAEIISYYRQNPDAKHLDISPITIKTGPALANAVVIINDFISLIQINPQQLKAPIERLEELLQESKQVALKPALQAPTLATRRANGTNKAQYIYQAFGTQFEMYFRDQEGGLSSAITVCESLLGLAGYIPVEEMLKRFGPVSPESEAEYKLIVREIQRKLITLTHGVPYTMDFSVLKHSEILQSLVEKLQKTDSNDKLWKDILRFIHVHLDVRTFQAT